METRAYGYGEALRPLQATNPIATVNHVEYRQDGVTEWYEKGPLGVEQGFTLERYVERDLRYLVHRLDWYEECLAVCGTVEGSAPSAGSRFR